MTRKTLIALFILMMTTAIPSSLFSQATTPVASATVSSIQKARPVWVAGREKEMNLNLGFRAVFQAENGRNIRLKLTASTIYRVYLNGEFVGSGPARAAHDYYRIDDYDISRLTREGENVLAVEVAGYNVNTYYTIDQPSFLLAEVEAEGRVVLATGQGKDFEAFQLKERLQKVERYSFQRPFTEYYRLKEGYDQWRVSSKSPIEKLKLKVFPPVKLLSREAPMPEYTLLRPETVYSKGTVSRIKPAKYHKDRSLSSISPKLKGYTEAELEVRPPSQEILEFVNQTSEIVNKPVVSQGVTTLKENEFYVYDFKGNQTGFLTAKLKCQQPTRIFFYFDEILTDGDVKTRQRQSDICNQIVYELEPGEYSLETIEAYTFRYLKVMVISGDCLLETVGLREFAYPDLKKTTFLSNNFKLNAIFDAAKRTFRQNAVDVFTDCPSRERAGWLCDSYFSAIVEKELTGKSLVAHDFFENYALPENFAFIPDGMIPMCYPADHNDGNFIPQWSLWFILQTEDYARRGGDPLLIAQLKPRIEKLLKYFEGFENSDGLLEKLPGWNFVEWSAANGLVQDVSYPTNMLYSSALSKIASIYSHPEWAQKAERIKETIRKQSFNGQFFVDNAVRENGQLKPSGKTTEVCQYYAYFFDVATPDKYPDLWKKLINEFGPNRNDKVTYPDVFRANAFVGNYLRMDLLSRYGRQSQMLMEIQDYFYFMADKTGTLWENDNSGASCNHGFASYIGHVLYRDVLGISNIDYVNKKITVRFTDLALDLCTGAVPVGDEMLVLQWERKDNVINYHLSAPNGFEVKIENNSSATLDDKKLFSIK
jgi:alpha-L-rhamnosidase